MISAPLPDDVERDTWYALLAYASVVRDIVERRAKEQTQNQNGG